MYRISPRAALGRDDSYGRLVEMTIMGAGQDAVEGWLWRQLKRRFAGLSVGEEINLKTEYNIIWKKLGKKKLLRRV